jgi:signal-transduction protein with cAMP-binding, CBS, and nucleotidyltransferase domain
MAAEHRTHDIIDLRAAAVAVTSPRSPIAALVLRPTVTIPSTARVADAAEVMRREHVSALLVEPDGGIVTERDIARGVGVGVDPEQPITAVETTTPLVVPGTMPIVRAAGTMLNEQVRHLVVQMPDGSSGVISMRDVLAVILQVADPDIWLTSLRLTIEAPSEVWLG